MTAEQNYDVHTGLYTRPHTLELGVEPTPGPIADNRAFGHLGTDHHRHSSPGVPIGVVLDGKGRHMHGVAVFKYPGKIFLSAEAVRWLQHGRS